MVLLASSTSQPSWKRLREEKRCVKPTCCLYRFQLCFCFVFHLGYNDSFDSSAKITNIWFRSPPVPRSHLEKVCVKKRSTCCLYRFELCVFHLRYNDSFYSSAKIMNINYDCARFQYLAAILKKSAWRKALRSNLRVVLTDLSCAVFWPSI